MMVLIGLWIPFEGRVCMYGTLTGGGRAVLIRALLSQLLFLLSFVLFGCQ